MPSSKISFPPAGLIRASLFLVIFSAAYLLLMYLQVQFGFRSLTLLSGSVLVFSLSLIITVAVFELSNLRKPSLLSGFSLRNRLFNPLPGAIIALALVTLCSGLLLINGNLQFVNGRPESTGWISVILLMAGVAITEETLFRAYLLGNLMDSFNRWTALTISALIFSVMHFSNPGAGWLTTMNVFIAGLLLGINYIFTRNLWFGILFHFTWNVLQGPVLGFPISGIAVKSVLRTEVNGDDLITGGSFGLEGSVLQGIFCLVCAIFLARYYMGLETKAS